MVYSISNKQARAIKLVQGRAVWCTEIKCRARLVQPHSTVLNTCMIKVLGTILVGHYANMLCSLGAETANRGPLLPFLELLWALIAQTLWDTPELKQEMMAMGTMGGCFPAETIGVGTWVGANRGGGSQFFSFANLLLSLGVLEDTKCLSLQGTEGLAAPYWGFLFL